MSYLARTHRGQRGVVNNMDDTHTLNIVAAGDLIVARLRLIQYQLGAGESEFNPDRLLLPPRWVYLAHRTIRVGGVAGQLAHIDVFVALLATADDVGVSQWPLEVSGHLKMKTLVEGWFFRGEKGVAQLDLTIENGPSVGHLTAPGGIAGSLWLRSVDWFLTDDLTILGDGPHFSTSSVDRVPTPNTYPPLFLDQAVPPGTGDLIVYSRGRLTLGPSTWYSVLGAVRAYSTTLTLSTSLLPMAAQWRTPASNSWLDVATKGLSLTWRHVAGTAGPQTGYVLEWTLAATTEFWDAAAGDWSASQVLNPSPVSALSIPPGKLANGQLHKFRVATFGAAEVLSQFSDDLFVLGVPAPTAHLTIPGYASGQVNDMTPQVLISGQPGLEGGAITGWRAELLDTNGVVLRSGSGSTLGLWEPGYEAANGEPLRFRVWVSQTGGEESPVAEQLFTVVVSPPGEPTVTTIPARWDGTPDSAPGVRIEASFAANLYDWTQTTRVLVTRYTDGVPALIADTPWNSRTGFMVEDYAAPTGVISRYTVQAIGTNPDGGRLFGAIGTSGDYTQPSEAGWVLDPTDPGGAVRCGLVSEEARKYGRRTVGHPLGRQDALVTSTSWTLARGSLTLAVDTLHDRDRLLSLLSEDALLLVRWCAEHEPDGDPVYRDLWFRWHGEITVDRSKVGPWSGRQVTVEFEEQYPLVVSQT